MYIYSLSKLSFISSPKFLCWSSFDVIWRFCQDPHLFAFLSSGGSPTSCTSIWRWKFVSQFLWWERKLPRWIKIYPSREELLIVTVSMRLLPYTVNWIDNAVVSWEQSRLRTISIVILRCLGRGRWIVWQTGSDISRCHQTLHIPYYGIISSQTQTESSLVNTRQK